MTVFIPGTVPVKLHAKVAKLIGPVQTFAKLHRVQDKESKKLIPFDPLPMQTKIFKAIEAGYNRIAVFKARQVAATTGAKMVLHHLCYTTPNEAMFALLSMREDSASALLDDNKRWLDDLPRLLQRPIKTKARNRIVYGDTGACIKSFTSRSKTGLRSFGPVACVVSEAAYAPDLAETIAQADAAVGEGLLMLESTANVPGDHFSQIIAGAPDNGWKIITLYWWEHPSYRDSDAMIPDDFVLNDGEEQLQEQYGLTRNQLHWRRRKVLTIGEHKFRREYPANMDDAFLGRQGGYYGEEVLQGVQVMDFALHGTRKGREIEAPHPEDRYVVGVDISGGVGGDYSALCVVSVATMQPVFTERCNQTTPAAWAHRVIQVASRYNRATVLIESNNHGAAALLEMNNCGYRRLWVNPKGKPWTTTLQSKLDALDTLREALGAIKVMDRVTWMELRALTIPPGKIAPEAPVGQHDDSAIAMALAYRCLRDTPSIVRTDAVRSARSRIDELLRASRARKIRSQRLPF